jgi:FkbM family methyltransferase
MGNAILQRWKTLTPFVRTFGLGATLSMVAQVAQKRSLIRTRVPSIKSPIYWRRHNSDLRAMYQTFGRREADVDLGFEPKTIFDLGANIGTTSLFLANKYPGASIVAVEPEHENCETFQLNCSGYANIRLVEAAVWTSNSELVIENPNDASWAFQLKTANEPTARKIPAFTLASLIEKSGFEQIDLLKMDIEGAEKEIFEAGCEEWLPKVKCLLVEMHDWVKPGCEAAVRNAIATRPHVAQAHGEYLFVKFTDGN